MQANTCKTSFSPFRVFLISRNSRERFWGLVFWHLWIGRARHLGPSSNSPHLGIEVLNVGGWLTRGDFGLDADVDFLAVVGHRLIPARVRSEWSRLKRNNLASIWSAASQVSPHVGHLLLCSPLPLLSSRGSLTVVGLSGVWFLLVLVGLCIFKVLILMLSSFR